MPSDVAETVPGKLSVIGFGEAGQAFVQGWGPTVARRCWVHDIKTENPATADRKRADYVKHGVTGSNDLAAALDGSAAVFSLVTADQAESAARAAAPLMEQGSFFFDCNSCSPGTKRRNADAVESAGGRYVDMAVMAPVHPALHKTPLIISGPHAEAAGQVLDGLGMVFETLDGPVGNASAIKMVRSIMMKGFEAVFVECVLAGRLAGVDERVLASLDVTYPGFDFKAKAHRMLERVMTHGVRRAAEMREVAVTVDELGLSGRIARASADWQEEVGRLSVPTDGVDYAARADAVLRALAPDHELS